MRRSLARTGEPIEFAKQQRRLANEFAETVWQWLRGRRCCNAKFRREVPIPPYTVDFCCVEHRLVVEVDGKAHQSPEGLVRDRLRDDYLRSQGYQILRISGFKVTQSPEDAGQQITEFVRSAVSRPLTPSPSPLRSSGARGARVGGQAGDAAPPCPAPNEPPNSPPVWPHLCGRFAAAFPPARYGNVPVVIAVSGGADSVALTRLVHDVWCQSPQADPQLITLAHFNHQLRGDDSDRDQQFVLDLAEQLGVACVTANANDHPSTGVADDEAAWRQLRYAFLEQTLAQRGARCLLTAHHADDQVETLLHHLFRGTGPAGLCGIASQREIGSDFMLYRPLIGVSGLGFSGQELRDGLRELGQAWREDGTNAQIVQQRNWIRNELLPHIRQRYPQADQAIGRLIASQRQWQSVIQEQAADWIDHHVLAPDAATLLIRVAEVSPAVAAAGLARLWDQQGWPRQAMDAGHYGQLHQRLIGARTDSLTLPGGIPCCVWDGEDEGCWVRIGG